MASIGELVIAMRADIASFRSGMNEAKGHLDDIKKKSSETADALSSLKRYFEDLVSIEGLRRLEEFAAGLVEGAAKIEHLTQALGVNAQQFQEQQFTFRQAGVDADVFGTSMEKLAKNLNEVATGVGSKSLVEVFSRLGLAATNFDGTIRSTSDLLDDLAHNKIFQAESETKKLADYMLLTGARGGEAALGVNALGASFDDSKAKALALNQVLSQDTIETLTALKDKLETDATAVKNFFATMLAEAVKANNGPNLYTLTDGLIGVAPGEGAQNIPKQPTADKLPGPPVQPGGGEQAKQLQSFNTDYGKLLSNYQRDLEYQQQLRTAYTEGAAAVRQLQVDHAGELAVYKLLDEAEAKHVQVTGDMLEAAKKAAEADENARLVADEQKKVREDLAEAMKKQDDAMQALIATSDSLTPKEQKLADTEGLLIQAFNRGLISADQFNQKMKELQQSAQSPDKGLGEFAKGLSTDLSGLIGKLADVQALVAESSKKGGQSIFQQLGKDAGEFLHQLEQLAIKLTIINPLLNSLGLGNEGNGKQLPTVGPRGFGGAGTESSTSGTGQGGIIGAIKNLFGFGSGGTNETVGSGGILGTIKSWFGFGASGQSPVATASTGIASPALSAVSDTALPAFDTSLVGATTTTESFVASMLEAIAALKAMAASSSSSSGSTGLGIAGLIGGGGGGGGGGGAPGGGGGTETPAFDLQRPGAEATHESGTTVHHNYIYSPTFVTPNADSFKKTSSQHGADAMRQMKNANRYV